MRGQLIAHRDDETLYSMMARLTRYLAISETGALHRSLFGKDMPVLDGMATNLMPIVGSGVFGEIEVADVALEWTTLPYHVRYAHPARREAVMDVMRRGGAAASSSLGVAAHYLEEGALKFCPACIEEMSELHADPWWRRSHQLPAVQVCPDHGDPLRLSTVTSAMRRSGYHAATLQTCPPSSETIEVGSAEPARQRDLLQIARLADRLLDAREELHPDDVRECYLSRLQTAGLLNRLGEADVGKIAAAMDRYWGDTLGSWQQLHEDGRCSQGWLGKLLLGEHRSPALHHLILEGLLDAFDGR